MTGSGALDNITIILVRPRIPENIGFCCRALKNMGLSELMVVSSEPVDMSRVRKTATHECLDVVENIKFHTTLVDAIAPFSYIAGTTARKGKRRQMMIPPGKLAEKIVKVARENRAAVLFGPEDRGLENDELRYCHNLVNIPTAGFASLNLSHAVMVVCYEIFAAKEPPEEYFQPRLASSHELEGMYEQLKEVLMKIDFLSRDNPDYWMTNFRRFATRVGLTAKETRLIRGVCRQVNWYGKKMYEDGLANGRKEREK